MIMFFDTSKIREVIAQTPGGDMYAEGKSYVLDGKRVTEEAIKAAAETEGPFFAVMTDANGSTMEIELAAKPTGYSLSFLVRAHGIDGYTLMVYNDAKIGPKAKEIKSFYSVVEALEV